MSPFRFFAAVTAASLLAACTYPPAPLLLGRADQASKDSDATTQTSSSSRVHTGRVLDLDGQPAAGVQVRGTLVSNNSGSLVSNKTGGYRIAAATLETYTDAQGNFRLEVPDDGPYNLEALLSDDVKAIALDVSGQSPMLELHLAYTGSISGSVSAPGAPLVTDFSGITVFIPGTAYSAVTDAAGHYQLDHVPVGTFTMVASGPALGVATVRDVVVHSRANTGAPALQLSAAAPSLGEVRPAAAGPGAAVAALGAHFGTDATFSVMVGGVGALDLQRVSDTEIRFVVPPGTVGAGVVVSVAGLSSATGSFAVLQSLQLAPQLDYLPLGRTTTFTVVAYDTAANRIASPTVTFGASGAALTSLGGGAFLAGAVGVAAVSASSGQLSATLSPTVTAGAALTTLAGAGDVGYQDGLARQALFDTPCSLARADDGTLYVLEHEGQRIRTLSSDGVVGTLAGSGMTSSVDGTGTQASFTHPVSMARDTQGNLWVTELESGFIRKVTAQGVVTTLMPNAPLNAAPYGIAVDPSGNVFVSEVDAACIQKITPSGQVTTLAGGTVGDADGTGTQAQFSRPTGLAFDLQGNLLVAEDSGNRIRRVTPAGVVTTVAGGPTAGAVDALGSSARFNGPHDLVVDSSGVIWVADSYNNLIRRINPSGQVTTVAGRGGPRAFSDGDALQAEMSAPRGLVVLPNGDLVIADCYTHRVRTLMK